MTGPAESGAAREQKAASEGGRLARWWKSLLRDYAEACREVAQGVRRRPVRAGLCLSLLAGAVSCGLRNPGDEASFECSLLEASGTLLLLSPRTRSGRSERHARRLRELRDRGQLRVRSLLLFSLLYEAPFDACADLYRAQCRHLQPRWAEFPARVLDVGFWGRWWVLRARMQDADVNPEEFRHLPERMRALSARHLRSEDNERLFREKFRPVVLTEEQVREAEREAGGRRRPS